MFYRVKIQEGHKANGKTSGKNHLTKIIRHNLDVLLIASLILDLTEILETK